MLASLRGIIVYIEYQSVCPFIGIGSPTLSPASQCVSPLGPKGGGATLEGAQFRQIDRKPGILYILWGKLYKYAYLYTQRRNIQYKKRIWNLESGSFCYLRNSVCKYIRNSGRFYCKKYRGIPYVSEKIPYSVGSQKRTSVDTLNYRENLIKMN